MKRPLIISSFCYLLCIGLFSVQHSYASSYNGFDITDLSLKRSEVVSGGPPRDGIPSISRPQFKPIDQVDYLRDDDLVVSIARGNVVRAYPTRILVWHEVVNDIVAGQPLAITYCPLCGTAMVFDRRFESQILSFGVSGLLHRSNLLMYDRQTESLWSQLAMKAVSGPFVGTQLRWLESEHLAWKIWRQKYPHGQVLSNETAYKKQYSTKAYQSYLRSPRPMFSVPRKRRELRQKAWVIGVIVDGQAKAYDVKSLGDKAQFKDKVANQTLTIDYNRSQKSAFVTDNSGAKIPSVMLYWFAWQAFYPNTELWVQ